MSDRVLFYPYGSPHHVPRGAPDGLVEEWAKLRGLEAFLADKKMDLEHWVESACLLRALVAVLGREGVGVADEDTVTEGRVVFGPMPKFRALSERQLWPDPASERAALRYHVNPAFWHLAGRAVATADFPDDERRYARTGYSLGEVLRRFEKFGHEVVLLKYMAAPKTLALLEFDLEEDSSHDIREWLGYEEINHPGAADAVLVQGYAEVRNEYRFFVVGGELVTGSGQIDELTPLARDAPTVVRGHRLPPCESPFYPYAAVRRDGGDLAAVNFRAFAQSAASQLIDAEPALRDFTLDVALVNGNPGVVELNPIGTSGFFASSPEALIQAVMNTVEKGR